MASPPLRRPPLAKTHPLLPPPAQRRTPHGRNADLRSLTSSQILRNHQNEMEFHGRNANLRKPKSSLQNSRSEIFKILDLRWAKRRSSKSQIFVAGFQQNPMSYVCMHASSCIAVTSLLFPRSRLAAADISAGSLKIRYGLSRVGRHH